jgi:hypothetical protein
MERMSRQDYYQRKAQELLALAQATHDRHAASWLWGIAIAYERLAEKELGKATAATFCDGTGRASRCSCERQEI